MHEYLKYLLFEKEEKQNNKFSTLFDVTITATITITISIIIFFGHIVSQPSQMHISVHTKLFSCNCIVVLHPLLHLQRHNSTIDTGAGGCFVINASYVFSSASYFQPYPSGFNKNSEEMCDCFHMCEIQ